MRISLLRISLMRFFKTFHRHLPYAFLGLFISLLPLPNAFLGLFISLLPLTNAFWGLFISLMPLHNTSLGLFTLLVWFFTLG